MHSVRKNRNSLYNFSDGLSNFAKGFIPLYYFVKSLSLIGNKKALNKQFNEEISKGNYIKREQLDHIKADVQVIEDKPSDISLNIESDIVFEKPEVYRARKIDNSLYDTYETPIEYITRETENADTLEITPYSNEEKIDTKKEETTKVDNNALIAEAIVGLSVEELDRLKDTVIKISDIKKELKLEKDVA